MPFFDLQINGYAGVDFNSDDLTAEKLHAVCAALKTAGVVGILATIVTEHVPLMAQRLSTLAALREADPLAKALIRGFHIEGPFLSPVDGYRGAHPADAIRPANSDDMKTLLDAAQGLTKLVTLAPECDANFTVTKWLAQQNIRVAAGHTDASIEQLRAALDNGLTLFTHLGNGCPMLMHRHDNIVQRALSLDGLKFTFIADGAHIPFFALKNYLRAAGIERCAIVTDAIAPAGLGPGKYKLARWELQIGDDMVARAPDGSHLVGAAITMPQSAQNLRDKIGLSDEEIKQLTWDNPRAFLEK
jgi:N-acetylglucosamine-6-phosphate deacetylase